jgi:hypothetical protein
VASVAGPLSLLLYALLAPFAYSAACFALGFVSAFGTPWLMKWADKREKEQRERAAITSEGLQGALEAARRLDKLDRIRFLLQLRKEGFQGVALVSVLNKSQVMH